MTEETAIAVVSLYVLLFVLVALFFLEERF